MSISNNIDSILEEVIDDSGFNENAIFGIDKIDRPETAGLKAAEKAASQFASASDGKDTDIDMIFQNAFPNGDGSGFDTTEVKGEGLKIEVDPNTIPAVPSEEDQFEDPEEVDAAENEHISDNELADDDDDVDSLDEMFDVNGYDDLY